jgi:O-antigen ligase
MPITSSSDWFAYRWVQISCYLALCMPLVYVPWVAYPFIFGKSIFFFAVVILALPWYLLLMKRVPELRPTTTLILYGLGLYLSVASVATIFSLDPDRSFWGYPERMTGLWPLMHYLALFFLLLSLFRTSKEWETPLKFSISVSAVVSLAALIQKTAPGLLSLEWSDRTGSLLGNPAFLSGYLLFNIFLTIMFLIQSSRWRDRMLWITILSLQLAAFVFAETRGAFIGLYLALLVFFSLHALLQERRRARLRYSLGVLLLVLLPIAIWLLSTHIGMEDAPVLSRFSNPALHGSTVEMRLIAWEIAWQAFKEKPVLGWGPETFAYIFNKFYDPRILDLSPHQTWFDRAHNAPLEQLSTTGIIGGLGYLVFYGLVLAHLIRLKRREIISLNVFSISTAILLSYLVQSLFLFDHPSVLLMLTLCLAWWHSLGARQGIQVRVIRSCAAGGSINQALLWLVPSILISILYVYALILQPALALSRARDGVMLAQVDIAASLRAFEMSLKPRHQYADGVRVLYAKHAAQHARTLSDYARAYDLIRDMVQRRPINASYFLLMATIQGKWGQSDGAHLAQALLDVETALALSPRRRELSVIKGQIHLHRGENEEAVRALRNAVDLNPTIPESWRLLSMAQRRAGSTEDAVASISKAFELERLSKQ